jgi:hypothetical protein
MFDVFIYTKKKNKFAWKRICVFYKNRIRVTKVQTTKEDDVLYLAHEKRKKEEDNKDDNTKLETLHAKKKRNLNI